MKKNILIFLLATLWMISEAFAQQQPTIIFQEYPDEWIVFHGNGKAYYDVNDDGISDVCIDAFEEYGGITAYRILPTPYWRTSSYSPNLWPDTYNIFRDLSIPLNDDSIIWGSDCYYEENTAPIVSYKSALRFQNGDDYYYGWFRGFAVRNAPNGSVWVKITETCFCTIPNYPLLWGQTSLMDDLLEMMEMDVATVHPNPTTGLVTITGKNLKSAEVLNTLGQRVATVQGKGETLQIDIANLPTGVYFVRITDEEGRKCVRKVVKE